MRYFQDTFETRKRSFISAFSICMTVPLRQIKWCVQNETITKNGVLPVITLFFSKFCFNIRATYKELI